MGFYIELPLAVNKARQLIDLYGAEDIGLPPRAFSDVPQDKMLICVVENDVFDAAGICVDEIEFRAFQENRTGRRRTWLYVTKQKLAEVKPHLRPYIFGEQPWRG